MLQYLPALERANVTVRVQSLFDDATLALRYERGSYGWLTFLKCYWQRLMVLRDRQQFDLLWIEKEALPWWPLWIEQTLLSKTPYVLDFDDAVFHHYDQHRFAPVRYVYGQRIDRLMANAALVVCGNDYLSQRARDAGAPWVERLPTVIDLERYPLCNIKRSDLPRVVWIGSPSTVKYLDLIRDPLKALAQEVPFILRVIGGDFHLEGVKTECLPWHEATEARDVQSCDVGIMPLMDTSWELGKCGYKLIQYMASALPVVASPVGVNKVIVESGQNGFLTQGTTEWFDALSKLLTTPALRRKMGRAGRERVEQQYCLQVTAPRLIRWLQQAAQNRAG